MSLEPLTIDTLGAQLGAGYERFDAAERARHVDLLRSVQRPGDVGLHVEREGHGRWTVTVCTADRLGALSMIAGLFTAYACDIARADIFTVRSPQRSPSAQAPRAHFEPASRRQRFAPQPPSRKTLDVFAVRATGALPPDVWERFRADLAALMALLVNGQREQAAEEIIDRVSAVIRDGARSETNLPPMSIDLANDDASPYTRLVVRSQDTRGFLFAFTNALAGFTVNIERATIRTIDGQAWDTFWVTDIQGNKIVGEQRIHELRVATALIKQFTHLLPRSADPGQALRQFSALIYQLLSQPQWTAEIQNLESAAVLETLADLMGVSRFLWEDFLRLQHENLFPVLLDVPALTRRRSQQDLAQDLNERLARLQTYDEQIDELNRFKDREMFRTDLRHITGRIAFDEFSAELTTLAEVIVAATARLVYEGLAREHGEPTLAAGRTCAWCICGLGKFGGAELGFGSDLELLFLYEGEGTTASGEPMANSQFFGHLVQAFQSAIRARQEGIFVIDLRLRPYGRGGALATGLDGFTSYYTERGGAEQFERMALVKLRPVAGDPDLGARVLEARDRFVYSGQPLDVANVRHLRHRQATELVPQGSVSAKYSHGGLVDVEYFVQARQIVAGHENPQVRVTNTLEAIERLTAGGHVGADLARELRDSYRFLRRLIDALRIVRGHAKDLSIPQVDSREFAYLAHRLHFANPADLQDAISARRAFARALWDDGVPPHPR